MSIMLVINRVGIQRGSSVRGAEPVHINVAQKACASPSSSGDSRYAGSDKPTANCFDSGRCSQNLSVGYNHRETELARWKES